MHWPDGYDELDGIYPCGQELPRAATGLSLNGYRDLSALEGVRGLRTLWVDGARPGELERLSALVPGLETLHVRSPQATDLRYLRGVGRPSTVILVDHIKVERLDGIEALKSAKTLRLDNFPRVRDLQPLAALTNLRRLSLAMRMSRAVNGGLQLVDSLEPLRTLRSLEELDCYAVAARDRDLSPLYALPLLAQVELPFVYGVEQIARLAGALGYDDARWPAVVPSLGGCRTRSCSHEDEVLLVGVRRDAYACSQCDAERIQRHVAEFEAWRAEGATGE